MNNDTRIADKFWSQVEKTDGCWEWKASKSPKGYGRCRYNGKQTGAHRAAYQLTYGEIEDGLLIDHICFTRSCCNPAHLRAVPQYANTAYRKGPNKNNRHSAVRGVSYITTRGVWRARVHHMGKPVYNEQFATYEEAVEAVKIARAKYHLNVGL